MRVGGWDVVGDFVNKAAHDVIDHGFVEFVA